MRRLILMRHAKSSWDSPTLSDHERALNSRGQRSARALGDWLRAQDHVPDQALVSSARRTQETMAGLRLGMTPDLLPQLYHASDSQMLDALRAARGDRVLMIGHNPGIADFAATLVARAPDHPRFHDYPTCATLVVAFDVPDWSCAAPGGGQVIDFVIPRDLSA